MSQAPLKGLRWLFVNPRLHPCDLRDEPHAAERWKSERAMNFGLLVVASHAAKLGAEVSIIDLEEQCDPIETCLSQYAPHVVGIGMISCYSLLSTIDVIAKCQALDKDIVTVVGGQNAGPSLRLLAEGPTRPDFVVIGDGEVATEHIGRNVLDRGAAVSIPGVVAPEQGAFAFTTSVAPSLPLQESSFLLYDLYPNWRTFLPLVEESRGCPCACMFCGNARSDLGGRRYRGKDPGLLVQEVEYVRSKWLPTRTFPCVLLCSGFGYNAEHSQRFLRDVRKKELGVRFLAAMRVDVEWQSFAEEMPSVFDQVHFGLESASPDILLRMKKTRRPADYVDSAHKAITHFHELGIHVACNFLLGYPGENRQSLQHTLTFLLSHADSIDSLWGGACIEYPGSPLSESIEEWGRVYGTRRRVEGAFCETLNAYPLDPSLDFSFEQMAGLSLLLMKLFNTQEKFYEHYRWYPGPCPNDTDPLAFYGRDEFFDLFLAGLDRRNAPFSCT